MSTLIEDTTGQMAKRLLDGWALSDQTCPTPDCNVPLLTKAGSSYCARCDGASFGDSGAAHPDSETSSASALSVSTPPTPAIGLPVEPIAPRTSDAVRDAAAREIGDLLLKGWCLLGDECPHCPGIPLMSRPRPRQTSAGDSTGRALVAAARSAGKLCVHCRREYVPPGTASHEGPLASTSGTGGAAARKRARIAEDQAARRQAPALSAPPLDMPERVPITTATASSLPVSTLENALEVLATHLQAVSSEMPLQVTLMGELADAMSKTARALQDVRSL